MYARVTSKTGLFLHIPHPSDRPMVTDRAPPDPRLKMGPEGIDCASLQEIVDIDPASLQRIVTALVAAQRTLRSERTRAGLATARQRGQRLGRPCGSCALSETQIALARQMLVEGATRKIIAQTFKVAPSTLYVALKPYSSEAPSRPKPPVPPRSLNETLAKTPGLGRRCFRYLCASRNQARNYCRLDSSSICRAMRRPLSSRTLTRTRSPGKMPDTGAARSNSSITSSC